MRLSRFGILVVTILFAVSMAACSRPESKIVGKWKSIKTPSSIEFKSDKTGIIHQVGLNMPSDLPFTWTILNGNQFKIEVTVPGSDVKPTASGTVEGNDTIVLEQDTFTKVK